MIDALITIIWNWIWTDSNFYIFLVNNREVYGDFVVIILALLELIAICIITSYVLWFWWYQKSNKRLEFIQWIKENYIMILWKIIIGIIIFTVVLMSWFWIQVFWNFAVTISDFGSIRSWLGFLFWYNPDAFLYSVYNTGRYIILFIISIYFIYNLIMLYIAWKEITIWNGEEKRTINYSKRVKVSWITLILIYVFLFSLFVDESVNWLTLKIEGRELYEIVVEWDNFND